jgi:hypothetical protein
MSFNNLIRLHRDPATDQALISGTANVIGQGITAYSAADQNKKQRQWSKDMYNLQREHALEDWYRTNEYNSPEAQMRRLQQAGLNPNLIYGQGAVANNSTSIRSSQAPSYTPQPLRVDLSSIGEAINMYNDIKTRTLQNSNLQKQGELLDQQKLYTASKILTETDKHEMYPTIKEQMKGKINLTGEQTNYLKSKHEFFNESKEVTLEGMRQAIQLQKAQANLAIANKVKADAQTNEINTLLTPRQNLLLQQALSLKLQQENNPYVQAKIMSEIANLEYMAGKVKYESGANLGFLGKFGIYGERDGKYNNEISNILRNKLQLLKFGKPQNTDYKPSWMK